jgi:hypothetical protein
MVLQGADCAKLRPMKGNGAKFGRKQKEAIRRVARS